MSRTTYWIEIVDREGDPLRTRYRANLLDDEELIGYGTGNTPREAVADIDWPTREN